jgi:hypothetical protein
VAALPQMREQITAAREGPPASGAAERDRRPDALLTAIVVE